MKAILKVKHILMKKHGTYRTTDLNYSVARVGDELQKNLINFGFGVNHNKIFLILIL